MSQYPRFPAEAWLPLAAGLFWLWHAPTHGVLGFLFSLLPGTLLLGSGVSMLLMPGDGRIAQFAAVGGALGAVLALPAFAVVGLAHGALLFGLSAAGFLAAGIHSLRFEPSIEDVPAARPSPALWAQVAADEAMLAGVLVTHPLPRSGDAVRIEREVEAARALFESAGWLEKPEGYHPQPPPPDGVRLRPVRIRRVPYEELSFESGYEPHPDEPGRARWLSYEANRTAHSWLVRGADPDRPWLVCVHGYQMGWPGIDLTAFAPEWLHQRLGLNLAVPVLPLHGKRKIGRRSGEGFIAGDLLDTVHAEAQAMWDLRRLLRWLRGQGASRIGVLGFSLGGYNTALLAGLEARLECAIAGVPLVDFARILHRHGPPVYLREEGTLVGERRTREVLSVVSPLSFPCKLPLARRALFGAVGDRLVPPDHVRDLWRHWERPRIEWYQGAHLTFRAHRTVRELVRSTLEDAGLS